jgi:hypothetical protein
MNAAKPVLDLLEARSANYSERPKAWMLGVLAGREMAVFTVSSRHPRFKKYRRLLHSALNPRAVGEYRAIQMQETKTLLKGLIQTPENFVKHIKRYPTWTLHSDHGLIESVPEMRQRLFLRLPMGIRSIAITINLCALSKRQ